MNPQTFIFAGPSGSGKGTQVEKLKEKLGTISEREILHFYSGDHLRELMNQRSETETGRRVKETLNQGGLIQPFLPIWLWADFLVNNYTGEEHLVIDGSPRTEPEAHALDSAVQFYEMTKPHVLLVDVSREESKRRLMERGRGDDTEENIDRRLDWYESEVKPAVEVYRDNEKYRFHHINGEQSRDEVHDEIMNALSLIDQ